MSKQKIKKMILQDLKDLRSLVGYKKYGLTIKTVQKMARGILLNLKDHLKELIR